MGENKHTKPGHITEQVGLDKHTPAQMVVWLRETAANTRRYSNPAWCDAHAKPYDPLAAHVAFRLEQAADLIAILSSPDAENRGDE